MAKFSILKGANLISVWLDILALFAWGLLLLKYALTGQLALLIHPNYYGLCVAAGIVLCLLACGKLLLRLRPELATGDTIQHITLFPQNFGSSLLIVIAIAGFLISPSILASQTAIQRGLTEELPLTRSQPESFRVGVAPEERTLLDWIRTLNAYPEPDAYTGDLVNVKGFVTHLPQLPDNYMMVSRFVLTCCAVDAYPVGLPVKLTSDRLDFPEDSWVQVSGEMITEELQSAPETGRKTEFSQRQLIIQASTVEPIETPANPYDY